MRLSSFRAADQTLAGVVMGEWIVAVEEINQRLGTMFAPTLAGLIAWGQIEALQEKVQQSSMADYERLAVSSTALCVPYTSPCRIWGSSLGARDHPAGVPLPTEPAPMRQSAMTIIGLGETMLLSPQSGRSTGAAELGVIIGKECRHVALADVPQVILGFTTVLAITSEDILPHSPRSQTHPQCVDTLWSFGPWVVTPDEVPDVTRLRLATLLNGVKHHTHSVAHMAVAPYALVAWHAETRTLKPGDIISCGSPGAVVIQPGDRVGCEISGIGRLENPVAVLEGAP